jgi:hypothetical protein
VWQFTCWVHSKRAENSAGSEVLSMTIKRRNVLAGVVVCLIASLASADSVSIPVTGTASKGFAITLGDFNINGPGLSLFQGLPDGSNNIGVCNIGAVCNFSFTINASGSSFCKYCLFYDTGSLGSNKAELLVQNLTFTGSSLYAAGTSISAPMTVAGTIVGYELINCSGGSNCSLGPVEFELRIAGQGTGQFTMQPETGSQSLIVGVSSSFTGTATTVPEPISVILTGTGLVGILVRKKIA